MTKEKVKQHYVPQFYLRYFSSEVNGNSVFCYDKKTSKTFKSNIKKICYEKGFYEHGKKTKKPIEDAFSFTESKCNEIFTKIINAEELSVLDVYEFSGFIGCLLLFKQRTRKRRDIVHFARELWLEEINSNFSDWKIVSNSENWEQSDHLLSMVELEEEELRRLCKNDWGLIINKTRKPFWTSDDPLIQQLVIDEKCFSEPVIFNYFPLTPNMLIHSQPLISPKVRLFKTDLTSEQIVNHFNRLTMKNAHRFVISNNRDFSNKS